MERITTNILEVLNWGLYINNIDYISYFNIQGGLGNVQEIHKDVDNCIEGFEGQIRNGAVQHECGGLVIPEASSGNMILNVDGDIGCRG